GLVYQGAARRPQTARRDDGRGGVSELCRGATLMRYLPLTDADRRDMLAAIGVSSIDDLFAEVPQAARHDGLLDLPRAMGELEVERRLGAMAAKNTVAGMVPFFLGAGSYRHHGRAASHGATRPCCRAGCIRITARSARPMRGSPARKLRRRIRRRAAAKILAGLSMATPPASSCRTPISTARSATTPRSRRSAIKRARCSSSWSPRFCHWARSRRPARWAPTSLLPRASPL